MNPSIKHAIQSNFSPSLQNDLISLRHDLHRHPELSNQEFKTQERLLDALNRCNVSDINTVKTGIIARIKGKCSTRSPVAIRADMDALPIQEATGVDCISVNDGVMHACGHDVHMAWAMGAARLLSETPAETDVILIFQPAEELGKGAKMMMDSGAIPNDIQAIFGGHVDRRYAVGEVVLHEGAISSFSDQFLFTIQGQSAHAARPNEGRNPIPILADVCKTIVGINDTHGNATNLVSITTIRGGERHNIIPDQASLSGTIRCVCQQTRSTLHDQLNQLAGSDDHFSLNIHPVSPAIINASTLTTIAQRSIHDAVGSSGQVDLIEPNMASEDFGVYASQFPAWFFRFGARYRNDVFIPAHNPQFFVEDDTVFVGAMVLANAARYASAVPTNA